MTIANAIKKLEKAGFTSELIESRTGIMPASVHGKLNGITICVTDGETEVSMYNDHPDARWSYSSCKSLTEAVRVTLSMGN